MGRTGGALETAGGGISPPVTMLKNALI